MFGSKYFEMNSTILIYVNEHNPKLAYLNGKGFLQLFLDFFIKKQNKKK